MTKLRDLYRGDGRIWHMTFAADIAGAVIKMAFKARPTDADDAALVPVIAAVLDAPEADGHVHGATLTLPEAASVALPEQTVHVGIRLRLPGGAPKTLLQQPIKVLPASPREV